jgi:hypothetical protein
MVLEVTETFKVTEAGLDELDHYELTNAQGEVIDGGIRGSLLDAFLEMAIGTEGRIFKARLEHKNRARGQLCLSHCLFTCDKKNTKVARTNSNGTRSLRPEPLDKDSLRYAASSAYGDRRR